MLERRELAGHDRPLATVRAMARDNRLPHALLITGRDGIGKTSVALALAADLTCPSPDADGRSCGECRSCELARAGTHPDILRVAPPKEETTIGQMRDLKYTASLSPALSSRRLIIVERAETLNDQAANAILKVLEDAPGSLCLLLLAPSVTSVISTIRSRSIHIALRPLGAAGLREYLTSQGVDEELADRVAWHADGAVGRALTVCGSEELTELIGRVDKWSDVLVAAAPEAALKLAEELRKIADDGSAALERSGCATERQAIAWVIDAAMSSLGRKLASGDGGRSAEWLASAVEGLNEARINILHYAQAELQLERALIRMLFGSAVSSGRGGGVALTKRRRSA